MLSHEFSHAPFTSARLMWVQLPKFDREVNYFTWWPPCKVIQVDGLKIISEHGKLHSPWACWSHGNMAELMGIFSKSIRVHLRCEVGGCMWSGHWLAEGSGIWLNSWGCFQNPSECTYAVKLMGACEVAIGLLKGREYGWIHGDVFKIHESVFTLWSWWVHVKCPLACWMDGNMAEFMLMFSKSIRIHFTLWRCWGYVNFTLACWTHGWPCEVKGILLNSWESILNPSEFCLRCEDIGCMCAVC